MNPLFEEADQKKIFEYQEIPSTTFLHYLFLVALSYIVFQLTYFRNSPKITKELKGTNFLVK